MITERTRAARQAVLRLKEGGSVMKGLRAVIFCAALALPSAAFAGMSDAEYCNALSATYRNVVGSTQYALGFHGILEF
jgi:hypothetical protein